MTDLENTQDLVLDAAVAEGGAYEILRRRLQELGARLQGAADELNERRLAEFGRSSMDVVGRIRIRTENNCVARDIVRVGDLLLFGYNVFMGLKKETRVEDVFSLYRLEKQGEEFEVTPVPLAGTFLDIPAFVQDFGELYRYYKNTKLLQLAEKNGKLLASFQIGEKVTDIRVFRWSVGSNGSSGDPAAIQYIDNRGERDIALPPTHDFEWVRTGREDEVNGRHPHINILDTVFVETVGGDLTIKRENNTEDGLGIYREDVLDKNQSLGDAVVEYAKVAGLILLRMLPYREQEWRHFVYNTINHDVRRIDAIGLSCIQLPEDHGIIFPGGYYLQSGEYKQFDQVDPRMRFRRMRKSPNGEDVLYIFYEPEEGKLALFNYNMIERQLSNPLVGHGYAMYEDGRMVLFEEEDAQGSRVHPMQIWQTPFQSDEFASRVKRANTPLGRIGNAELVRGISDLYNIVRQIDAQRVSAALYGKLAQDTRKLFDAYFWLKEEKDFSFAPILRDIAKTGELVLDEYEKVESIRRQSERALAEAQTHQKELFDTLVPDSWENIQEYADGLTRITTQRGRVITLRNYRYMDLEQVDGLEQALAEREERVNRATAEFLAGEKALAPFNESLQKIGESIGAAAVSADLIGPRETLDKMSADLDMLSGLISSLSFDDVTMQTRIIEGISEVFARVNQARSRLEQRRQQMGGQEAVARFGAQFKLFGQSIASALGLATDPERCDEELSRLLLQLEELESQFSGHESFQADILQKREELLETFETHKQSLLDERQRKTRSLQVSAERILATFPRRTAKFTGLEEINAFFVADPMARKVAEIAAQLRELKDTVKADDVESRFKAVQDQALRSLRDKTELYEDGGSTIKLGPRHRFSVNTQDLDLTILPAGEGYGSGSGLALHLTGTDYHEAVNSPLLDELREFWNVFLESESPGESGVSRAEYLAYSMIYSASKGKDDLSFEALGQLLTQPLTEMEKAVRVFAAPRYREGYEKGIHDHDAAIILRGILPLGEQADLLRYAPEARALAMLFWHCRQADPRYAAWPEWAKSSLSIRKLFRHEEGLINLQAEMEQAIAAFAAEAGLEFGRGAHRQSVLTQAGEFLSLVLSRTPQEFVCSKYAKKLLQGLRGRLQEHHLWSDFRNTQKKLGMQGDAEGDFALFGPDEAVQAVHAVGAVGASEAAGADSPGTSAAAASGSSGGHAVNAARQSKPDRKEVAENLPFSADFRPESSISHRWKLAMSWLRGLGSEPDYAPLMPYAAEAAALVLLDGASNMSLRFSEADLQVTVKGLLSDHARIREGQLFVSLDDFFSRMRHQRKYVVPGYRRYQEAKQSVLEEARHSLRLEEFKPKPLSSFVRNKLIDQVYLPLIGDNLAKQIGTAGAAKRTDLMGLLMMISPPGYGKTTLMEYVAHALGLIFMKINGPALGHSVISLDPAQAPDATSRQELEKLGLALEMGNNVMLYLDDIQHCNPEFLQKFISLCDATRRIEGVWKGRTKTYDMRGKKFCVVMAGNPYTESGEVFKIPDMLANRADVYNLGEVLGGMEDAFALSYLENALTSNAVLAPLAQRDMADLYSFIDRASGKAGSAGDLSYNYSDAEVAEIIAVLERLLKVRDVVMKVNGQYIASAAQADSYRTEPPFKLQGSYRSMNKLAEQVSGVMNDAELDRLITDFYVSESQLLTGAAEENLLKLAEIRGKLGKAQKERWTEIKRLYVRGKSFGGDKADVGDRVVAQLSDLVESIRGLAKKN